MAISTYTLVAFYRNLPGALEAGVKYLVQSALGSVFVLLGISLVLGHNRNPRSGCDQRLLPGRLPVCLLRVDYSSSVLVSKLPWFHCIPGCRMRTRRRPRGISAMLSGVVIEAGLIALLRVLGTLAHVSNMWGGITARPRCIEYDHWQPDGFAPDPDQTDAGVFKSSAMSAT